jgi:large subunit ribosomal protein L15
MADILSKLAKPPGSNTKKTRKGRGVGSGLGKTAGRGSKGQYARGGVKRGFEGGQTPLMRRLPKRGFTPPFPTKVAEINVGSLEVFGAGAKVDETSLRDHGLIKGQCDKIKILGNGDLTKSVIVTAHAFSKGAAKKIEKAGGKAILVNAIVNHGTAQ